MFNKLFNLCLALFLILVIFFYTSFITDTTFTIILDYFYPLSLILLSSTYIYENKKFNIFLTVILAWSIAKILNNFGLDFNDQLGFIIILIFILIITMNVVHKIIKNKNAKNLETYFENKTLVYNVDDLENINHLNILSCFGVVEVILPKNVKVSIKKNSILSKVKYEENNNIKFNKEIIIYCTSIFSKVSIKHQN